MRPGPKTVESTVMNVFYLSRLLELCVEPSCSLIHFENVDYVVFDCYCRSDFSARLFECVCMLVGSYVARISITVFCEQ